VLLFDFDGVLVNSLTEIALSAYNYATGDSVYEVERLPPDYLRRFKSNRHLLLSPDRLGELAKLCLKSDKVLSREEFLKTLPTDRETLARLGEQFYTARQRFIDEAPELWLKANPPFELLWNAVSQMPTDKFAILTYKNRIAVELICNHYGLATESIYSGEGGRTKAENIRILAEKYPADEYIFLDDAIENLFALTPVLPGRIRPILASWGYCSAEDLKEAAAHNMETVDEAQFVELYL
jgi:phosphoglycolate phosphatase-like HAD superfamily hydrolase